MRMMLQSYLVIQLNLYYESMCYAYRQRATHQLCEGVCRDVQQLEKDRAAQVIVEIGHVQVCGRTSLQFSAP